MNIRQLLTASAIYGVADMLVLGVGGFLLLPLYTRALPQAEFGAYVIVRANIEILGYVLTLGLLSAVSRLYFDHKKSGRPREYFNSILTAFFVILLVAAGLIALWGDPVWRLLAPSTPSQPYIWYSLAVAAVSFTAGLGSVWLRLDSRVNTFVTVQIIAAAALATAAWFNLIVLKLELSGLLIAFVIGYLPATAVLLFRIGTKLRPASADASDIRTSLVYGLPFVVSYVAFFLLNRFSVMTLQHHVPIDQIAIFGLAQQLALLITVVSQSFGKAMQPAVFGADAEHAPEVLRRSSRLFILLIFGAAGCVVMFSREIVQITAPAAYLSGLNILLVLLIAGFIYSLNLVSNTALEYHRRPKTAAAVSVVGAVMSVILGLALIPRYQLMGGAIATLGAYFATSLASHIMAYRLTRQSHFGQMGMTLAALCGLALLALWPGWQGMALPVAVVAKLAVVGTVFLAVFALYAPQRLAQIIMMLRRLYAR
ncbi:lipopolysaccharide biosynthesis protein [Brevundimonas sp. LjRoot202]|uniref:lipopolysaccharide biosynthesis protein n=1 Tax=Brevundimonas sp. LjRoot202 TaxID=3342281 RepID=UPI003ECFC218